MPLTKADLLQHFNVVIACAAQCAAPLSACRFAQRIVQRGPPARAPDRRIAACSLSLARDVMARGEDGGVLQLAQHARRSDGLMSADAVDLVPEELDAHGTSSSRIDTARSRPCRRARGSVLRSNVDVVALVLDVDQTAEHSCVAARSPCRGAGKRPSACSRWGRPASRCRTQRRR